MVLDIVVGMVLDIVVGMVLDIVVGIVIDIVDSMPKHFVSLIEMLNKLHFITSGPRDLHHYTQNNINMWMTFVARITKSVKDFELFFELIFKW